MDNKNETIIAVANSYISKYYLDSRLLALPVDIKNKLKFDLVSITEENGGIIESIYDDKNVILYFKSYSKNNDFLYDEIGMNMKIKKMIRENEELYMKIAMFCKIKFNNDLSKI